MLKPLEHPHDTSTELEDEPCDLPETEPRIRHGWCKRSCPGVNYQSIGGANSQDPKDKQEAPSSQERHTLLLLRVVFYFTLLFSLSEIFAGIISNSLLLLEESVHMFADSASYGINLWAELQRGSPRTKASAELVGTGVSLLTLAGTLVFVFVESIDRLWTDKVHAPVDAKIMLGFGVALTTFHFSCLVAFFCGVNVLHSHSHSGGGHGHSHGGHQCEGHAHEEDQCIHDEDGKLSLNAKSALFHVFVDFLHSAIVIVTACIVLFTSGTKSDAGNAAKSSKIDAVASLLLCGVIFFGCYVLLKSFVVQLRQFCRTETSVDPTEEAEELVELPLPLPGLTKDDYVSITLT